MRNGQGICVFGTRRTPGVLAILALVFTLIQNDPASGRVFPGVTDRASVDSSGNQASGGSFLPAISGDGRFVAFQSEAADIVAGDTNGLVDVFIRDRESHVTTRASVSSTGGEANGHSGSPAISGDGRYIAFQSDASNLVTGDTNGLVDVFVYDRLADTTQRVSLGSDGRQADDSSFSATISRDGRFIGFVSGATNLVVPDSNDGKGDVFVHDRATGATIRVSIATNGEQADDFCNGPLSMSADGQAVAYYCRASNLAPNDTNDDYDVFVHDVGTGTTEAISVADDGVPVGGRDPVISSDGRYVAFLSFSARLMARDSNETGDIFLRDRSLGRTVGVSVNTTGQAGDGFSGGPSISGGGEFVAFYSAAGDLVPRDNNATYDIFLYSIADEGISQLSLPGVGPPPTNAGSQLPSINTDGHVVAFQSDATNLVRSDTNGRSDVFVFDTNGCLGPVGGACGPPDRDAWSTPPRSVGGL